MKETLGRGDYTAEIDLQKGLLNGVFFRRIFVVS